MQLELTTVIIQAVADAHKDGLDYTGETKYAVRAVLRVRPDLDTSEALSAVDQFRENKESAT